MNRIAALAAALLISVTTLVFSIAPADAATHAGRFSITQGRF